MYWDADAYAEGICNSAAGSSIQTLIDELTFVINTVIEDAIEYRRSDDDDEDGRSDNEQVDRYVDTRDRLQELMDELQKREEGMNEDTERYTIAPFANVWEILDSGASFEDGRLLRYTPEEAQEEADKLNATE